MPGVYLNTNDHISLHGKLLHFLCLSFSSYGQMMESPISIFPELLSSLPQSVPSHSKPQFNETVEEQESVWVTLNIPNTRIWLPIAKVRQLTLRKDPLPSLLLLCPTSHAALMPHIIFSRSENYIADQRAN